MNYKVDWWDNFNEELYCNYLIQKDEQMFTYKITYKYYKGNNEEAEMCVAIKYVQADDKPVSYTHLTLPTILLV